MFASPKSNQHRFRRGTPPAVWTFALLLAFSFHAILFWHFRDQGKRVSPVPRVLSVEWILPEEPKAVSFVEKKASKLARESEKAKTQKSIQTKPEKDVLLNRLIQKTPAEKLSMKLHKTSRSAPANKKNRDVGPMKEPEVSLVDTKEPARKKTKTPSADTSGVRNPEPVSAKGLHEELKDAVALLEPLTMKSANQELLSAQKSERLLKPLPENWMLRKNRPTSSSPGNPKSTLSSLLRRPWLTEDHLGPAGGIPPPPGSSRASSEENGFYTLSDYDWPYESYMGRWAKALLYHWNNNPPLDYITRRQPQGGEVFVLVSVLRNGQMDTYEVTGIRYASEAMESSVVNAVLSTSQLPSLPKDLESSRLQVHFRFVYPPLGRRGG